MTLRYGRCARSPSMRRWSVCCFHRALKWHSASAHRPAPLSTTASIHSVCSSIERAPLSTISVISHTRFSTTELSLSALLPQRTEQIGRQHRIQAFEQPKPRGIRMEPASAEGGTESGRCEHALVVNTDVLDVHGCIRSALRTDSHRKGMGIPRQLPSCEPCDQ